MCIRDSKKSFVDEPAGAVLYYILFENQNSEENGMTAEYYENINHFLVGLFNDILKIEGKALRAGEYREIDVYKRQAE